MNGQSGKARLAAEILGERMNTLALRGCSAVLAVTVGALAGCANSPTSSGSAAPAGTASPGQSAQSSAPGGTLADVLLQGAELPAGLSLIPAKEITAKDMQYLGPSNRFCRGVAEEYANSPNTSVAREEIQIQVSICGYMPQRMPITWLVEAGMYGQPNFTDVTAPEIIPGATAIAEIATPSWFYPPTASVREVIVTWAYGPTVATVVVGSRAPFVSYASESGVEALARLQAARITSFASLIYDCAYTAQGDSTRCGQR
jgi:hypothetical protein